jgi:hypothetical protein
MEAVQEKKNSQAKPNGIRMGSFFSPVPIQTKLKVNQPGDKYEVEADQVAEQVIQKISISATDPSSTNPRNEKSFNPKTTDSPEINAPKTHHTSLIQPKCDDCEAEEKENLQEEEIQRKHEPHIFFNAEGDGEDPTIMTKKGNAEPPVVSPHTSAQLFASKGSGDPLPKNTRSEMERGFGVDFSKVKIHTGHSAVNMSKNLGAQAFTHGSDIYFNSGKFEPNSQSGKKLLAHELTHVVQQSKDRLKGSLSFEKIQRACSPSICPPLNVPVPAWDPFWRHAESCINEIYKSTHRGNTISFQKDYILLSGKTLNETMALSCVKNNFTAKSGMHAGEPDIWDFTNQTMYEITTTNGAAFRTGKLAAELKLANDLCSPADCGGLVFGPGTWSPPSSCYLMDTGLYLQVFNLGGVLVYNILRDVSKELAVATAALLAAAAAKNMKKGALKKAVPGLAVATAAAAFVLLISGKAQAGINTEGEDPLEQLFKAMDKEGNPVPSEIQELIKQNPDLKAKMEKALKSGDTSTVQKEFNDQILKLIKDHPDEFSKEDLESLLTMTGAAQQGLPQGQVTIDQVKKMLETKQQGSGVPGSPDAEASKDNVSKPKAKDSEGSTKTRIPDNGSGKDSVPSLPGPDKTSGTGTKPSDTQSTDPKFKALNEGSKKLIHGAPKPVQDVFKNFTSGQEGDAKINDEVVKKFFDIVPVSLTDTQSKALIDKMGSSIGKTIEEVLSNLKKGVEEVLKPVDSKTIEPPKQYGDGKTSKTDSAVPPKTGEEIIAELKEKAKGIEFEVIPIGKYQINNLAASINGTSLSALIILKVSKSVGAVAYINGTVPEGVDVNKMKNGESFIISIDTVSPIVDKDGKVYNIKLGKTITITK